MITLLIVMTPGIPEYMTGSSNLTSILFNTPSFFIGLILNIALYSTGALLIREFAVKFNKGWLSILILGLAYGIMEEGISVHTFFITSGSPVGILGIYGRYLGVDWIWALGISFFHSVFSIGLPIFLLSIAYPKYSREPLLGRRGAAVTFGLYVADVLLLNLALQSTGTRPTLTVYDYVFFLFLSILFVLVAKAVPGGFPKLHGKTEQGAKKFYILGFLVFPLYLVNALLPATPDGAPRIPPFIDAALYIVANVLIMLAIVHHMPREENRRHKFALSLGMITPLFIWAELMQFTGANQLITLVTIIGIILLLKLRGWIRTGKNLDGKSMSLVEEYT